MKKILLIVLGVVVLGLGGLTASLFQGWYGAGPLPAERVFTVPDGANIRIVAAKLQESGAVYSARAFHFHARLLGRGHEIKAGEFLLPAAASESEILEIISGDKALRRFVTVPEGMPAIMVHERLMAQPYLTGEIQMPAEGSILPDSYDIKAGETRAAVLARMQGAMTRTLAELWDKRGPDTVARTPEEAVILASIVEKETGKPSERPMVAGLYSNRIRQGIMLQADPTIIYPITKGKPLGRRILKSEIAARNDYNTYAMQGLPKGPITNPSRASIEAVLHPAKTDVLYMVADGTGGHAFATTLEQHNANVEKWFVIRRSKGEI
ncbi:endolytic transglycosylase MltG [Novosphingobium sp. FSY-8]|uniref:Endolytic murein transglycosylase n=1 Tax=Novosphingobium ovatum TaxID=1908523 RepID=A0ABW9X9X1_9SPHN|nr:endolytic transglycosylase MltG [Novosphingobium ovatum]NBC35336.1 endolytic transglycosylase MltG [Novosphingobium ovatum]